MTTKTLEEEMIKKTIKRLISLVIVLMMVLTMMPLGEFSKAYGATSELLNGDILVDTGSNITSVWYPTITMLDGSTLSVEPVDGALLSGADGKTYKMYGYKLVKRNSNNSVIFTKTIKEDILQSLPNTSTKPFYNLSLVDLGNDEYLVIGNASSNTFRFNIHDINGNIIRGDDDSLSSLNGCYTKSNNIIVKHNNKYIVYGTYGGSNPTKICILDSQMNLIDTKFFDGKDYSYFEVSDGTVFAYDDKVDVLYRVSDTDISVLEELNITYTEEPVNIFKIKDYILVWFYKSVIVYDSNYNELYRNTYTDNTTSAKMINSNIAKGFNSFSGAGIREITVDENSPQITGIDIEQIGVNYGVKLTVNTIDDLPYNLQYSYDDGLTWTNSNISKIYENGTVSVIVKDKADRISETYSINVNGILSDGYIEGDLSNISNNSVKGKLYNNGILEISGSGIMKTFSTSTKPFFSEVSSRINEVIISSDVVGIGAYLLSDTNVTELKLPSNVKTININSFKGMTKLQYIYNYCTTSQNFSGVLFNITDNPELLIAWGTETNVGFKTEATQCSILWKDIVLEPPIIQKKLVSIDMDNSKIFKTLYKTNESIDMNNMNLKLYYSDGTSQSIQVIGSMLTGFDTSTLGNKTVTVTYEGKTCTFTINIVDTVQSIQIKSGTNKTQYYVGDTLDLTGTQLIVTRESGGMEFVNVTSDMVTGFETDNIGDKIITITYGGKIASYIINVKENSITGIELVGNTYKTEYILGETLDINGLEIKVNYANGTNNTIPVDSAMISGFSTSTLGTKTITVTYLDKTTTYDINVSKSVNLLDAEIAVQNAESSKKQADYDIAKQKVDVLDLSQDKNDLQFRLQVLEVEIALDVAEVAITRFELTETQEDYNDAMNKLAFALTLLNNCPEESEIFALNDTITFGAKTMFASISTFSVTSPKDSITSRYDSLNARLKVKQAEVTQDPADIQAAKDAVDKLPTGAEKDEYTDRVETVEQVVIDKEIQDKIDNADSKAEELQDVIDGVKDNPTTEDVTNIQDKINEIQNIIDTLPNGPEKDRLQEIVDNLQDQLEIIKDKIATEELIENIEGKLQDIENLRPINESNVGNVQDLIDEIQDLIDTLPNGTEKDRLQDILNDLQDEVDTVLGNLDEQTKISIIEDKLQEIEDKLTNVTESNASTIQDLINEIQNLINNLKPGTEKDRLQNELDQLQDELDSKVRDIELAKGIEIEQGMQTLSIGQKVQLTQTSKLGVTWTSSDNSIVTVNSTGRITAVAPGEVIVKVTITGTEIFDSIKVKVTAETIKVTGLDIQEATLELKAGESSVLNYTVSPLNASDKRVTWVSSNNSIATVVNGTITAISKGTAVITGTTVDSGYADGVTVNVLEVPQDTTTPVKITVTPRTLVPSKTVTVDISVEGKMLEVIFPNGSRAFGNPLMYTLRENGAYTFGVMGKDKESTDSTTIEIDNIDNEAPIITFVTSGSAISTVTVNAVDDSGIDKAYSPSGNLISLPYEFDARSMTGTFVVIDKAGNRSSKDYQLSTVLIGTTTEPTFVALDGIPKEWTNKPATITVGAENQVDGVVDILLEDNTISKLRSKYSFVSLPALAMFADTDDIKLSSSKLLLKDIEISSNGNIEYTIITSMGSYTDIATIDKIDIINPTLEIEVNKNKITYIAGDNASGVKSILLPTGEAISGVSVGNTSNVVGEFTMLGNGEFDVIVEDYAGNVFTKSFNISSENPNIEKPEEPVDNGGSNGGGNSGGGSSTPEEPQKPNEAEKETNIAIRDNLTINKINGYINGYDDNTFRPNEFITRAEVSQIISNIVDGKGNVDREIYDIENKWYTESIKKVVELGIMKGFEDNSFRPDNYITRQDFAITLTNLLDIDNSYGKTNKELNDISYKYGKTSIELLISMNVINGYEDNTFKPDNSITRAEAITMINKLLDDYIDKNIDKNHNLIDIDNSWAVDEIIRAYIIK
jgi:uncharacterized protein YjdB